MRKEITLVRGNLKNGEKYLVLRKYKSVWEILVFENGYWREPQPIFIGGQDISKVGLVKTDDEYFLLPDGRG